MRAVAFWGRYFSWRAPTFEVDRLSKRLARGTMQIDTSGGLLAVAAAIVLVAVFIVVLLFGCLFVTEFGAPRPRAGKTARIMHRHVRLACGGMCAALVLAAALERHMLLGGQSVIYGWRKATHARRQVAAAKVVLEQKRRSCDRVDTSAIPRRVYRVFSSADPAQGRTAKASRRSWEAAGFLVVDHNDGSDLDTWFTTAFELRHEYMRMWRALNGVQRSDFFRLAVLWSAGGWWADSDVDLLVPPELWCVQTRWCGNTAQPPPGQQQHRSCGLRRRAKGVLRPGLVLSAHDSTELVQWGFGAVAKHAVLRYAMELVRVRVEARIRTTLDGTVPIGETVQVTGPSALTDAAVAVLDVGGGLLRGFGHMHMLLMAAADAAAVNHPAKAAAAPYPALMLPLRQNPSLAATSALLARGVNYRLPGDVVFNHALHLHRIHSVDVASSRREAAVAGLLSNETEAMVSRGALVLGRAVFQSRYMCHSYLGSWKYNARSWLWGLRHQWREQFRLPCTFWE